MWVDAVAAAQVNSECTVNYNEYNMAKGLSGFSLMGIDPLSAMAGMLGGLIAGYLAQYLYKLVVPYGSKPMGEHDVYVGGSGGNAPPAHWPSAVSAVNPLVGVVVLLIMNAVAAWLVLAIFGRVIRDRLAESLFAFGMGILQLDDWLVLSRRIVAPIGGDPLIGGQPADSISVDDRNAGLARPFPQYSSIPRPETSLFPN